MIQMELVRMSQILIPVGLWHYVCRAILRLFWLSARASPLLIPMQPKKESLGEFFFFSCFSFVISRHKARGANTVHLTTLVKVIFKFVDATICSPYPEKVRSLPAWFDSKVALKYL